MFTHIVNQLMIIVVSLDTAVGMIDIRLIHFSRQTRFGLPTSLSQDPRAIVAAAAAPHYYGSGPIRAPCHVDNSVM